MRIGMDVGSMVDVGACPWAMVDEQGVVAPAEACAEPPEAPEGYAEGYGGTEADGATDEEAGSRRAKDDEGVVDGDIVEVRIIGLDFDVTALVDDVDIGVGGEIAVAVRLAAQALDGVHHVGALDENRVAELAGPVGIAGHHVEYGWEGPKREDAGVPREGGGGDGSTERIALQIAVRGGPGGGVRELIPISGCGEQIG